MNEISKTGYWNAETAHLHHVHSQELSNWICEFLKNEKDKYLNDLGCGLGNYLNDLRNNGFTKLNGYEGDPSPKSKFGFIFKCDLTKKLKDINIGNIISLEVGEHIPAEFMDIYLDNITNNCDNYLITSWAIRGQEGFGHVNCLNNEEIIPLIEKRGFTYLKEESESARSVIKDNTWWFKNTILIFKKNEQ